MGKSIRVRVSYLVEMSESDRRSLNAFYGRPGLASRDFVKREYEERGAIFCTLAMRFKPKESE